MSTNTGTIGEGSGTSAHAVSLLTSLQGLTLKELDQRIARRLSASRTTVCTGIEHTMQRQAALHGTLQRMYQQTSAISILVRTNCAGGRPATHDVDSSLIATTLRAVRDVYPNAKVVLADGPAFGTFEDVSDIMGWTSVARKFNASRVDLNHTPVAWTANGWPYSVLLDEHDLHISLCRAKTHRRFALSLTLKGLLGFLSGSRLGQPKLAGRHRHVFAIIAELLPRIQNVIAVIDGNPAIEGEGPMDGRESNTRFSVVSDNAIGADVRSAIELGIDPSLVPLHLVTPQGTDIATAVEIQDWPALRKTDVDIAMSGSYSWLSASLRLSSETREHYFQASKEICRRCLTPPSNA